MLALTYYMLQDWAHLLNGSMTISFSVFYANTSSVTIYTRALHIVYLLKTDRYILAVIYGTRVGVVVTIASKYMPKIVDSHCVTYLSVPYALTPMPSSHMPLQTSNTLHYLLTYPGSLPRTQHLPLSCYSWDYYGISLCSNSNYLQQRK
jgi:hypothetical protein